MSIPPIPTDPNGWPYLNKNNWLRQLDTYSQQLVAKITGAPPPAGTPPLDSGWIALPVSSSHAAYTASPPMIRRIGAVVYARGGWLSTGLLANNSGAGNTMATVSAQFRPTTEQFPVLSTAIAGASAILTVAKTGEVRIRTGTLAPFYFLDGITWIV